MEIETWKEIMEVTDILSLIGIRTEVTIEAMAEAMAEIESEIEIKSSEIESEISESFREIKECSLDDSIVFCRQAN